MIEPATIGAAVWASTADDPTPRRWQMFYRAGERWWASNGQFVTWGQLREQHGSDPSRR